MLEVIIAAQDEALRTALRQKVPWEQHGFTWITESADGELALSQARRDKPDLLVMELSLPILDGLELCRQVRRELPRTKLVLLCENSDVRTLSIAVDLGVDAILPLPLDIPHLLNVLHRLRKTLEREAAQQQHLAVLEQRAAAHTFQERARFFDHLVTGLASVSTLYSEARALGIELRSDSYNFLLCLIRPPQDPVVLERLSAIRLELTQFFQHTPQFELFFERGFSFCVLIRADEGRMEAEQSFCIKNIRRRLLPLGNRCQWSVSVASPVNRISALSSCYNQLIDVVTLTSILPGQHVLTPATLLAVQESSLESELRKLPTPIPLSEELDRYLKTGTPEQANLFASRCVDGLGQEAMQVPALCRYIMLRVRMSTIAYVHNSLHLEQEQVLSAVSDLPPMDHIVGRDTTLRYIEALLRRAAELRDTSRWSKYHAAIRQGLRFIDQNFPDSKMTLNRAAEEAGVSPNYFSALFRKQVGVTFGTYLMERRMCRARDLLRNSSLRSAQIARAVGYQDVHYFSTLFHRVHGCTPREYRTRADEFEPHQQQSEIHFR